MYNSIRKKLTNWRSIALVSLGITSLLLLNYWNFVGDTLLKALADNVTISCTGSYSSPDPSITESSLTGDDVTIAYGSGDGYCEFDDDVNPNSLTVQNGATLIIDAAAQIDVTVSGALVVENGGKIIHKNEEKYGININVGSVNIENGGSIDVDARGCEGGGTTTNNSGTSYENGYGQSTATGTCTVSTAGFGIGGATPGGGSYGGSATSSGGVYGDEVVSSFLFGSGGGRDDVYGNGGDGGGKVAITASGNVNIDGTITADGGDGEADSGFAGGGGSGGTIKITAGSISGAGTLSADGGDGVSWTHSSYAGAGGRIYLAHNGSNTLAATNVTVAAGTSGFGGATAGTIMAKDTSISTYKYYCQGTTSNPSRVTESAYLSSDSLTFADYNTGSASDGWCTLDNSLSLTNITVEAGAQLTHADGDTDGVNLTTTGDITVTGSINTDGRGCSGGDGSSGYGPDSETGICTTAAAGAGIFVGGSSFGGSGAGHGGIGGLDSGGALASSGATYGSESNPTFLGSGGASGNSPNIGGDGGGRVYLNTGGDLIINGQISANGGNGTALSGYAGGGGSGGSIYVETNEISGLGLILAAGGNGGTTGGLYHGGGGGGGRVSVSYATDNFGVNINSIVDGGVKGSGTGQATDGAIGTIYGFQPTTVQFTDATSSVEEDGLSQIITIESSAAVDGDTSVDYTVLFGAGGGTATGDGTDFTIADGTATILDGETSTTIEVQITEDGLVEGDETVVLSLANPTNGASVGTNATHTLTITDNDSVGVTVAQTDDDNTVSEDGLTTDTFTVVLSSEPTDTVTVNLALAAESYNVSMDESSLEFTTENWDEPQTVTISAIDNDIDEGASYINSLEVTTTSSDLTYNELTLDPISVTVLDNDTASINIVESDDDTTVSEDGSTDTFTIVLGSEPIGDVNLEISAAAGSDNVIADPTSLVFTSSDWDTPQTITVSATDDGVDQADNYLNVLNFVSTSADAYYDGALIDPLTVNISDNDSSGIIVTETDGTTAVGEAELVNTDTFSISLSNAPAEEVVVSLTADTEEFNIDTNELIFTLENWSDPQTVTITAIDDQIKESTEVVNITYTVTSIDDLYSGAEGAVSVTVTDDDVAGLTITESDDDTIVSEGTDDTVSIVLTSEPTANVTLSFSTLSADFTYAPETLVFTPENWNETQELTISGTDDALIEGTEDANLFIFRASDDTNYFVPFPSILGVTITDNDTAGVSISGAVTISEEGATSDTIPFTLNTEPESDVTINLSTVSEDFTFEPESLVFTSENWDEAQNVTVTAVDDTEVEGDETVTLAYLVLSEDDLYAELEAGSVGVFISDNDTEEEEEQAEEDTTNGGANLNSGNKTVTVNKTEDSVEENGETQAKQVITKDTYLQSQNREVKVNFEAGTEITIEGEEEVKSLKISAPKVVNYKNFKKGKLPKGLNPEVAILVKTNTGGNSVKLSKSARITVERPEHLKVVDPKEMEVWFFNEKTEEFEKLDNPNLRETKDGKKLVFETDHFTYFVVVTKNENGQFTTQTVKVDLGGHWVEEHVAAFVEELSITETANIFPTPDATITRSEIIRWTYNYWIKYKPESDSLAINELLKKLGIIIEDQELRDKTPQEFTRVEAIKLYFKLLEELKIDKLKETNAVNFVDVSSTADYYPQLAKLVKAELFDGPTKENNYRFYPESKLTKAEALRMLAYLIKD